MNAYVDWFVSGDPRFVRAPTTGATAFDLVRRTRAKHVRLFQRPEDSFSADQWFSVLEGAKAAKLEVTIVTNLSDARFDDLKRVLSDKRVAEHESLFAIDYGEMILVNDQSVYGMRRIYELARSKAPQVALTMGGWRSDPKDPNTRGINRVQHPAELGRVIDYLDFISVHVYNIEKLAARDAATMAKALEQLLLPIVRIAKGRQIVISEFGAPSSKTANDMGKTGDPETMAKAYALFLSAVSRLPADWKVRSAWAYILLDDGSPTTKGWALFTESGEKRTPAVNEMRLLVEPAP